MRRRLMASEPASAPSMIAVEISASTWVGSREIW